MPLKIGDEIIISDVFGNKRVEGTLGPISLGANTPYREEAHNGISYNIDQTLHYVEWIHWIEFKNRGERFLVNNNQPHRCIFKGRIDFEIPPQRMSTLSKKQILEEIVGKFKLEYPFTDIPEVTFHPEVSGIGNFGTAVIEVRAGQNFNFEDVFGTEERI